MPLKIIRNDIIKMNTEAIVNTTGRFPEIGSGCDTAVYNAAGREALLKYRKDNIGYADEGEAFLTPGFNLQAKYIIHTVSPLFKDGLRGEEKKLRACYRNCLRLAKENGIKSVSFPLISTGSFRYPREEGLRIALDEINAFLLKNTMDVNVVVFDEMSTELAEKVYPGLRSYIDRNYVNTAELKEYRPDIDAATTGRSSDSRKPRKLKTYENQESLLTGLPNIPPGVYDKAKAAIKNNGSVRYDKPEPKSLLVCDFSCDDPELYKKKITERMLHIKDTFSDFLFYLIQQKNMKNSEIWRRGMIDKKLFSKIKNNPDYHPNKMTVLCLCIGAKLNLDEAKDLLARAGYALSPCDKTDIIFSFFIENGIYDMVELDLILEEYNLPCVIA